MQSILRSLENRMKALEKRRADAIADHYQPPAPKYGNRRSNPEDRPFRPSAPATPKPSENISAPTGVNSEQFTLRAKPQPVRTTEQPNEIAAPTADVYVAHAPNFDTLGRTELTLKARPESAPTLVQTNAPAAAKKEVYIAHAPNFDTLTSDRP
jgi:hypothetical protein